MNQPVTIRRYTLNEYLAMEPEGSVRHEFINGEMFAMVGTSRTHNAIATRLSAALYTHLRGTPCRVASNDMKVLIESANRAYYPDLVVSCNDPADEIDIYTETQPRLIVEILSPSTEHVDRREKRLDYQLLDSLQDYILIAQDEVTVEIYHRHTANQQPDAQWSYIKYTAGDTIEFKSIDLNLPIAAIYDDIA